MTNTIPATAAIGHRSKPNHPDRAVDISQVFGLVPAGDVKRRQAAADAGAKSVSAEPMTTDQRADAYRAQRNGGWLTRRQYKRIDKKMRANGWSR